MQEWITVMTFTWPHESYLVRGALEAEGIDTFLKDELTIQVDNFLSNVMWGIRLQVPKGQVSQALRVLNANGYLDKKGNAIKSRAHVKIVTKDQSGGNFCPFCHSENIIETKRASILTVISLLLFRLPLPVFKRDNYCFDCESSWKYKK